MRAGFKGRTNACTDARSGGLNPLTTPSRPHMALRRHSLHRAVRLLWGQDLTTSPDLDHFRL